MLAPIAAERPTIVLGGVLRVPVRRRQGTIAEAVRRLDEAGVGIDDVAVHRPTLDDVFLALTGHAAEEADEEARPTAARRRDDRLRYAVSDTLVLAERNLLRIPRAPDLLISFTVQPIMFVLLFAYVFGGAITRPGFDYIDFLMPGIIAQTMAFGGFVTALGLADDLKKGLIDRFRSLPMARSAVLAGRTLADVATNMISLAIMIIVGLHRRLLVRRAACPDPRRHRPDAALRLRLLLDLRLVGLTASSPESAQALGFILIFPLTFISSAFVPVDSMPAGLQTFAEANPFTTVVNAMRALCLGAPAGNEVWGAVALVARHRDHLCPLSVARYRRAVTR